MYNSKVNSIYLKRRLKKVYSSEYIDTRDPEHHQHYENPAKCRAFRDYIIWNLPNNHSNDMSEKIRDVSPGRPTQIVFIMKFIQINQFMIIVDKCGKKLNRESRTRIRRILLIFCVMVRHYRTVSLFLRLILIAPTP